MAEITLIAAWLAEDGRPRLPLGILYLAGELLREGHEVDRKDCQMEPHKASAVDLIAHTLTGSYDIIGISCMSDLLPAVLLAVTRYKEQFPASIVVLGGPGPTSVALDILLHFPAVNYVVVGEGERTFSELISKLENGQKIQGIDGLCYRAEKGVHCGKPRERIKDLDKLHPLPYSAVHLDAYSRTIPISTSRGCTYGCSFCDVRAIWQRKVTYRSLDNVIAETNVLSNSGVTKISIVDDTFVLNRARVLQFCQILRESRLSISWHCNGRINLIDDVLIENMGSAGCASMFFGVESGSDAVLKRIRKGFTKAHVLRSIKIAAKYIPLVTVSFIWGFPFETLSDFQETRDLYLSLAEMENVRIQLYELTPFINAPIYQKYSSQLFLDTEHVTSLNGGRSLSKEEMDLIQEYPQMFPNFYHFPTLHRTEKLKAISDDSSLLRR